MSNDTTSQATLEKVRELMDKYECVPHLSETRVYSIHAVYDAFPSIASLVESQAKRIEEMGKAIIRAKQDIGAMRDCRVYEKDEIISNLHEALSPLLS